MEGTKKHTASSEKAFGLASQAWINMPCLLFLCSNRQADNNKLTF